MSKKNSKSKTADQSTFGSGLAPGFGFGQASQQTGFGFGQANQQQGFGAGFGQANSAASGFGSGFGQASQQTGFGFGQANQQPGSGFGQANQQQGFGAGFGQANPAASGFGPTSEIPMTLLQKDFHDIKVQYASKVQTINNSQTYIFQETKDLASTAGPQTTSNQACKFTTTMYDLRQPNDPPPNEKDRADPNNPDPDHLKAVSLIGISALTEREENLSKRQLNINSTIQTITKATETFSQEKDAIQERYKGMRRTQQHLNNKMMSVMKRIERLRCRGLPLQSDEEEYHSRLLSIQEQLIDPKRTLKRLSDLKYSIPTDETKYDSDLFCTPPPSDLEKSSENSSISPVHKTLKVSSSSSSSSNSFSSLATPQKHKPSGGVRGRGGGGGGGGGRRRHEEEEQEHEEREENDEFGVEFHDTHKKEKEEFMTRIFGAISEHSKGLEILFETLRKDLRDMEIIQKDLAKQ